MSSKNEPGTDTIGMTEVEEAPLPPEGSDEEKRAIEAIKERGGVVTTDAAQAEQTLAQTVDRKKKSPKGVYFPVKDDPRQCMRWVMLTNPPATIKVAIRGLGGTRTDYGAIPLSQVRYDYDGLRGHVMTNCHGFQEERQYELRFMTMNNQHKGTCYLDLPDTRKHDAPAPPAPPPAAPAHEPPQPSYGHGNVVVPPGHVLVPQEMLSRVQAPAAQAPAPAPAPQSFAFGGGGYGSPQAPPSFTPPAPAAPPAAPPVAAAPQDPMMAELFRQNAGYAARLEQLVTGALGTFEQKLAGLEARVQGQAAPAAAPAAAQATPMNKLPEPAPGFRWVAVPDPTSTQGYRCVMMPVEQPQHVGVAAPPQAPPVQPPHAQAQRPPGFSFDDAAEALDKSMSFVSRAFGALGKYDEMRSRFAGAAPGGEGEDPTPPPGAGTGVAPTYERVEMAEGMTAFVNPRTGKTNWGLSLPSMLPAIGPVIGGIVNEGRKAFVEMANAVKGAAPQQFQPNPNQNGHGGQAGYAPPGAPPRPGQGSFVSEDEVWPRGRPS